MEISVTVGSLRIASPLSSPRGPNSPLRISTSAVMNSPSAVLSPRSPTCPNISYDHEIAQNRSRGGLRITGSASGRNNGGCATEERQDVAFMAANKKNRNHYSLLGVPRDAPHEDIRQAYRRLALQYHPDVMPLHQLETATRFFAAINEAYDTLSDPHRRKAYDALHPAQSPPFAAATVGSSFGQWRGKNWETDQCWC